MNAPTLLAAFCTRSRPDDLARACASLAESVRASGQPLDALLIVDGGALDEAQVAALRATVADATQRFEHIDASAPGASLLRSRLIALRRARELGVEYVAFFDDDVEMDAGYAGELRRLLAERKPAGVSGIDTLRVRPGAARRAWNRFTGLTASEPGRLSASGFAQSQVAWGDAAAPFETEYLSGCNMTLATRVLDEVPAAATAHFTTYSLAEDVLLSGLARRLGALVVDPGLRVRHHQSPASREGRFETGRQLTANLVWLHRRGLGPRSGAALAWSASWILLRSALGDVRAGTLLQGKAAGMLRGVRDGLRG